MPGRRTIPPGTPPTSPVLSDVEHAVLKGRAGGLSYMQIAAQLRYTYRSAKDVGERVLRKLGARDMAHAVLLACHAGILDGRPQRHGDHAGFAAHQRRGEDPWDCPECAAGERDYRRDLKARRKDTQNGATKPTS